MPRKLVATISEIAMLYMRHNGPLFARGIAYSLLLGSMPMLLLTLASASFFYENTPQVQTRLYEQLSVFLPDQITSILVQNLESMTGDWAQFGIVGLVFLFLVSKGIFDSIGNGLIGIMGGKRHRTMWVDHFYSLVLTILTILIVVVAAMDNILLNTAISLTGATLPQDAYPFLLKGFSIMLLTLALFLAYMLYATIRLRFFSTLLVAGLVSVLWYALGFAGRNLILFTSRRALLYGVFAAAALFLFWLQIFSHLVLIGGIVIFRRSAPKAKADTVFMRQALAPPKLQS